MLTKQSTKLSWHHSRQPHGPAGWQGRAPGPHRLIALTLWFPVTVCFMAMQFSCCASLLPPQTHGYPPSFQAAPLSAQGTQGTARPHRRGLPLKVSFPWLGPSSRQRTDLPKFTLPQHTQPQQTRAGVHRPGPLPPGASRGPKQFTPAVSGPSHGAKASQGRGGGPKKTPGCAPGASDAASSHCHVYAIPASHQAEATGDRSPRTVTVATWPPGLCHPGREWLWLGQHRLPARSSGSDSSRPARLPAHRVQPGFGEQPNAGLENSPRSPDSIKELIKI